MTGTYVITFRVKEDYVARFRALLDPVLDATRPEATIIHAALHVSPDQPNVFQLYETWTDRNDELEVQLQRPYRREWHAALDELLVTSRDIAIWQLLRADH